MPDADNDAEDVARPDDTLGAGGVDGSRTDGANPKGDPDGNRPKDGPNVKDPPLDGADAALAETPSTPKDTGPGGNSGTGGIIGTGGVIGSGGVVGSGGVPGLGGVTGTGGSVVAAPVKLSGKNFGSGPPYRNNPNVTFEQALDGDIATYFDDQTESNGYVGFELLAPATVVSIRYYPRAGCESPSFCAGRMVGGKFQCSTVSRTTGWNDLHEIKTVPPMAWVDVKLAEAATCRFLRYLGPAHGFTNVSEIEFWGQPGI